jgi:hypothetical protein
VGTIEVVIEIRVSGTDRPIDLPNRSDVLVNSHTLRMRNNYFLGGRCTGAKFQFGIENRVSPADRLTDLTNPSYIFLVHSDFLVDHPGGVMATKNRTTKSGKTKSGRTTSATAPRRRTAGPKRRGRGRPQKHDHSVVVAMLLKFRAVAQGEELSLEQAVKKVIAMNNTWDASYKKTLASSLNQSTLRKRVKVLMRGAPLKGLERTCKTACITWKTLKDSDSVHQTLKQLCVDHGISAIYSSCWKDLDPESVHSCHHHQLPFPESSPKDYGHQPPAHHLRACNRNVKSETDLCVEGPSIKPEEEFEVKDEPLPVTLQFMQETLNPEDAVVDLLGPLQSEPGLGSQIHRTSSWDADFFPKWEQLCVSSLDELLSSMR